MVRIAVKTFYVCGIENGFLVPLQVYGSENALESVAICARFREGVKWQRRVISRLFTSVRIESIVLVIAYTDFCFLVRVKSNFPNT